MLSPRQVELLEQLQIMMKVHKLLPTRNITQKWAEFFSKEADEIIQEIMKGKND